MSKGIAEIPAHRLELPRSVVPTGSTATDDVEENDSFGPVLIGLLVVLPILMYLTLNILGTIYYTKLKSKGGWAAVSVALGWILLPPLNIISPVMYASGH